MKENKRLERDDLRINADKLVEIQGVTVHLSFAPKGNEIIPSLVRDVLKAVYVRQHVS